MMRAEGAVLASADGGPVVLKEVQAAGSIDDLLAEVAVTQRYVNPGSGPIEVVYTFPLPIDGVLLDFEVEVGDRRLAGAVVGRSAAERRYEDAITDGDAATLLEQVEPGLYTASVGNLAAGETAVVRFRYAQLLRWNGDRVSFRMPTTVAPRYSDPAAAGLQPHQTPEHAFDAVRSFGFTVAVRGTLADARFDSPTHGIGVTQDPERAETSIALTGAPAMDRDFVLDARAARPAAAGALAAPDLDGWVVAASFHPEIPDDGPRDRRSVTIVIDCSGSMMGDSIAQARAALERILDGLRDGDHFEIIAFGSGSRALFGRAAAVSEATRAEARRFVRALDAHMGGTEIERALEAAWQVPGVNDLRRDLLLITDGEVWDDGGLAARARASGHRIFTVGVGSAVAEGTVRALAEATGGACELVSPRENMSEWIHRHFQRMYTPRARSVAVRWPAPVRRCAPDPIETVHCGDTLHLFAWFAEKPAGTAVLEVTLADGRVVCQEAEITAVATVSPPPTSGGSRASTLARVAAARRLSALDGGTETGGDARRAAADLAVRYQLVSRWTHCLVIHLRAESDKATGLPAVVKVPQVLAAGWHGMGTVAAAPAEPVARLVFDAAGAGYGAHGPAEADAPRRRRSSGSSSVVHGAHGPAEADAPPDFVHELLDGLDVWFGTLSREEEHLDDESRGAAGTGRTLPDLDELAAFAVPDRVMAALRDLVDRGEDEAAVVAAFLRLLAESDFGAALDRQGRRRILKACKTTTLSAAAAEAVRAVFDAWVGSLEAGPAPAAHQREARA